ncbi:hypothetical protein Btru_013694 [Bulinus truncatus]|nr:hypothetical protein Btru_013694 [Bulinus truncatus]
MPQVPATHPSHMSVPQVPATHPSHIQYHKSPPHTTVTCQCHKSPPHIPVTCPCHKSPPHTPVTYPCHKSPPHIPVTFNATSPRHTPQSHVNATSPRHTSQSHVLEFFSCCCFFLIITQAACQGGAEDMKSLLNATLANYNNLVIPRRSYTQPLEVKIQLVIPFIETLDVKNQLLKFFGMFRLIIDTVAPITDTSHLMTDDALSWAISKNKPFDSIRDSMVVNIFYDGTVMYTPTDSMEVSCEVVISKFPYDHHKCDPGVSQWMHDNTSIHMVVSDDSIDLSRLAPHGQFMVSPDHVFLKVYDYGGRFFESCSFSLKLTRRPGYMILTLLLPVCLISLLEGVSLVMSPEESEKLSISITILLSFTVFLGVINENLPETSENISLMVIYITALQLLAFLVVIGNATVYALHHKRSKVSDISTRHALADTTSHEKNDLTPGANNKNTPQYTRADHSNGSTPLSTVISRTERLNTRLGVISFALFVVLTAVFFTIVVFF